ncbi:MAG TPA: DUF695 domain-containing protein [Sphingobacteriaceae bacterium]
MRSVLSFVLFGLTLIACGNESQINAATQLAATVDSVARPKFTTLHFSVDGKPCSATIDERYQGFAHKNEFPLSLFVTITTAEKDGSGHPTTGEAEAFSKLEAELLDSLNAASLNAFIGKTTMNGYRDLIFYIKHEDQAKINKALSDLQKRHSRIKNFTFEDDPQWEAVAEFYGAMERN